MMKHTLALLFCSLAFSLFGQNLSEKIDPEIRAAISRGESPDALVIFTEKADLSAAARLNTKSEKARFVFAKLQQTAANAQRNALNIITQDGFSANTLFLVNALSLEKANAALLQKLAALPEVKAIAADPWVKFDGPVPQTENTETASNRGGPEWGLIKIGAPDVWNMGYTGQGITVGGADTGYDWGHPAIQSKYRGWTGDVATSQHNYNWHDAIHELNPLNADTSGNLGVNPCGLNAQMPCDDGSHGTHTMGTMTGSDGDNQIGVAPDAKWVGCRNMERGWGRPSSYIECFQWFLAPTDLGGQNPNPDKAPHVVNNSWYCAVEEGCNSVNVNELVHTAVINLKASGVVVVVSNGNSGPDCSTTSFPAEYFEESFCVGATRSDNFIAKFSSRGPVFTPNGNILMKPNVSAPGVDVRSSVPGNNYANFSGTSMAGPHVVGLVALILSANPALAGHVEDIENIVEQTAVYYADTLDCGASLGMARPNHAYGWGRVDALGAVQAALQWQPAVGTITPDGPQASVVPNPVGETAIFTLENVSGETSLEIVDAAGKLVWMQKWMGQTSETLRVSLGDRPNGIYFWKLKSGNGVASGKLLK